MERNEDEKFRLQSRLGPHGDEPHLPNGQCHLKVVHRTFHEKDSGILRELAQSHATD